MKNNDKEKREKLIGDRMFSSPVASVNETTGIIPATRSEPEELNEKSLYNGAPPTLPKGKKTEN